MAEISHIVYQMPDVFIIFDRERANKDNHAYFSGENSTVKLLGVSIFFKNTRKNFKSNLVLAFESKGFLLLLLMFFFFISNV